MESNEKIKTLLQTRQITDELKNEIINKWESLGLLTPALNKRNLAIAFEIVVYYMVNNNFENNKNFSIEIIIFPIIAKIFLKNTDEKDMKISDIIEKVNKIYYTLLTLDNYNNNWIYFSDNFKF